MVVRMNDLTFEGLAGGSGLFIFDLNWGMVEERKVFTHHTGCEI